MDGADFYTRAGNEMTWIGSIPQNGQPHNIPAEILLKVNKMDYEESVVDFIVKSKGSIDEWPWEYKDSRMTNYCYIFNVETDKVLLAVFGGGLLLDPIKLYQGEDINSSIVSIDTPVFPVMKPPPSNVIELQKRRRQNGSKPSENV